MTVSALVLTNEHIVTQNKNKTGMIYVNAVVKSIVGNTDNNSYNLYGTLRVYTYLHHE